MFKFTIGQEVTRYYKSRPPRNATIETRKVVNFNDSNIPSEDTNIYTIYFLDNDSCEVAVPECYLEPINQIPLGE